MLQFNSSLSKTKRFSVPFFASLFLFLVCAQNVYAAGSDDPFRSCTLNIQDLAGKPVKSIRFTVIEESDNGVIYYADAGLIYVRIMFNPGHMMSFKYFPGDEWMERDVSFREGYFAIRAQTNPYVGGVLSIANKHAPNGFDSTQFLDKESIFQWAVDSLGYMRGFNNISGKGSPEEIQKARKNLGKDTFNFLNLDESWISFIRCSHNFVG